MYSTIEFYNTFHDTFEHYSEKIREHYSEKTNSNMKILIKLPSRSRPNQLIKVVKE